MGSIYDSQRVSGNCVYDSQIVTSGSVTVSATGVVGITALGVVSVTTGGGVDVLVNVTGLSGTASLGTVLVWGLVDTAQTPNWTRIAT